MKKILSITIAAAALLSIASCQKENLETPTVEPEKTVRVITGEFYSDGTKTTLGTDNKTPLWSVGDVIRVLNSTACEDITIAAGNITDGGRKISFTTGLTGMLYAVYPASATTMTSCTDGNITFTIPAVQDGTFGSANICVASGDGSTGNSIYFSNATAVVEMTVKSGVEYANLAAVNNIAGNMTVAIGDNGAISTTTPSLSSKSIFVTGTPSGSKLYMAVAPVETGAVTITCYTSTKSGSAGKSSKTLAMNKIYAMNLSEMTIGTDSDLTGTKGVLNGQEYVLIRAKYDGTNDSYLKWATQNLAITASGKAKWNGTNYQFGDYFQWGIYDGYVSGTKPENMVIYTSFTYPAPGTVGLFSGLKDGKFFRTPTAPYLIGDLPTFDPLYSKYTGTNGDGKPVLEQSDDVANIVLGSTWRMHTGGTAGEFQAMRAVTYWAWDVTDDGYYVFNPGVGTSGSANGTGIIAETDDKTKALLFFHPTGVGPGSGLYNPTEGYYWSSSSDVSSESEYAYYIYFYYADYSAFPYVNPGLNHASRFLGMCVRPVSD